MDLHAVEIEINHACNRSCSYCPNSILDRKTKGSMSSSLFQTILERLIEVRFTGRISFHLYNEPLLHPKLQEFVALSKRLLPLSSVHLYSNGTLLTSKLFEDLKHAGVDKFIITRHEQDISSSNYVFAQTWKNLTEQQKLHVVYQPAEKIHFVNRGGLLPQLGQDSLHLHPCHLPTHMLSITVDGRVLSCFEDFNEVLVFGDLKTQTLTEIWNSSAYSQFRKKLKLGLRHQFKPCDGCNRREALPPFV
jgi:radical SAM protein with 4Fe4S-binding SPASM domain